MEFERLQAANMRHIASIYVRLLSTEHKCLVLFVKFMYRLFFPTAATLVTVSREVKRIRLGKERPQYNAGPRQWTWSHCTTV